MTKANVIEFSRIRGINEIPSICEYAILENFVVESFYVRKHAHSTDLYDFRLVDEKGRVKSLFYGMLEGDNSNLSPDVANDTAGEELHERLNAFAKSAPARARCTNKCLVEQAADNISLIACTCERGTIIGGWYNSCADRDISLQMLAYCMYSFAALNSVSGAKDKVLKEKAVDTIPDDSRFGKYPSNEAEAILIYAIAGRHERMLQRALRTSVQLS